MSYSQQITRQSPSLIMFLVDQSGSMSDRFGDNGVDRTKAERLADAINRLLQNLVIRCTKDQAEGVGNYYDVGVIGYGHGVGPALGGALVGKQIVTLKELADNPLRIDERGRKVEDGAGGLVEETVRLPVWFEPVAENGTPMVEALRQTAAIVGTWATAHPNSFPPIVINITDGESTDGDPRPAAWTIADIETKDGKVLVFNAHLSSRPWAPVLYPSDTAGLLDEFAKQLFEMSSPLPPHIKDAAKAEGYPIAGNARGFVFNADIVEVIKFLDIGTRATGLR